MSPALDTLPRARFAVSRLAEAGRGAGPTVEHSQYPLYDSRTLGLWDTVEELRTCSDLTCSVHVRVDRIDHTDHAYTTPTTDCGWNTCESVYVTRTDGKPLDPRMMLWLWRAAGLAWSETLP